ncbi:hypothetical protein [Sorangium sp. So ce1335]|uniref:hypothetical protein n=1 Tax=Sorangium sp. So ce1335 TaxID=3133335 RepID=UPI003F623DC2
MESTFSYRVIKSSWGIRIDLTADVARLEGVADSAIEIAPGLWFVNEDAHLDRDEEEFLKRGVQLVAADILSSSAFTAPSLVRVTRVWFVPTDYQPEGLTCAMAAWAAERFGFSIPKIDVRFSRQENRCIFNFERPGEPPSS